MLLTKTYFSSGVKLINLKNLNFHSIERLSENRRKGIHNRIRTKLEKQRAIAQEKKAKEEARQSSKSRKAERQQRRKEQKQD